MPPALPASEFPHLKGKSFREPHHSNMLGRLGLTAPSATEYIKKLLPQTDNEEELVAALSGVMVRVGNHTMHRGQTGMRRQCQRLAQPQ